MLARWWARVPIGVLDAVFSSAASASISCWLNRLFMVSHSESRFVNLKSPFASARAVTDLGPCFGKVRTERTSPGRGSLMFTITSPLFRTFDVVDGTAGEGAGDNFGHLNGVVRVAQFALKLLREHQSVFHRRRSRS